jgi:acyl-CoA thioesterase FadM
MSKIFTRKFRVRWSETNANGQVGIRSYLRYLMETAWDWGAAGQLSLEDVKRLGQTWVVRETQLRLFRPLYYIVDNTVYAAHAEEAAARALAAVGWSPPDLKARGLAVVTRRIHLQYKSPAVRGDRLQVVTYLLRLDDMGGDWYVAVQRPADGAGIVRCVLSWGLVDRVTGEAQPLPGSLAARLKEKATVTG